jgi:hypothetical protein
MPICVPRSYGAIFLLRNGVVGMRIPVGEVNDVVADVVDRRCFALESYWDVQHPVLNGRCR